MPNSVTTIHPGMRKNLYIIGSSFVIIIHDYVVSADMLVDAEVVGDNGSLQ